MTKTHRMIRHIPVLEKTSVPPSHSVHESDVEESLDREIASLRQLVEGEAQSQETHKRSAVARSSRAVRLLGAICTRARHWITHGALQLPMGFIGVLRQARRFFRERRVEIVIYGFGILGGVVAAWLSVLIADL